MTDQIVYWLCVEERLEWKMNSGKDTTKKLEVATSMQNSQLHVVAAIWENIGRQQK